MERVSIRMHLLLCRRCRRFMKQFRIMTGTASKLNELEQPSDQEIDDLANQLSSKQRG